MKTKILILALLSSQNLLSNVIDPLKGDSKIKTSPAPDRNALRFILQMQAAVAQPAPTSSAAKWLGYLCCVKEPKRLRKFSCETKNRYARFVFGESALPCKFCFCWSYPRVWTSEEKLEAFEQAFPDIYAPRQKEF